MAMGLNMSAESMGQTGNVYTFDGAVKIKKGNANIEADSATYDEITGEAKARGNVHYEDPFITMRAPRATLNLDNDTGILYDGEIFIKKYKFRVSGKEIHKIAENRYILKNATATTCDGTSPDWCLRGTDMDIMVGERVKVKHATFRIKTVPVFYSPYIWAPIITERRTGFLSPTGGYRKSTGLLFRQPFFLVISENRDATFYFDYYSKRAMGQGIQYRYVEGPSIYGELNVFHIKDRELDRNYYETRAAHRQSGRNVSSFLNINTVNFTDYYRRYEPSLHKSAIRFMESSAEISAAVGNSRAYLLGQYYQDLMEGADEDTVLNRLPEAGYFQAPFTIGPVAFMGTASAANFQRETGMEGMRYNYHLNGIYTVGRVVPLTQAFSAGENIYRLIDRAAVSNASGVDMEHDFERATFGYNATLQTRIGRDYQSVKHEIVPSISYIYTRVHPEEQTPPLPILDSTELVSNESQAEVSLNNRFMYEGGSVISIKAIQRYDFNNTDRPLTPFQLDLAIRKTHMLTTAITYDTYEKHINTANTTARFHLPRTMVSASQNYTWTRTGGSDTTLYTLNINYSATQNLQINGGVSYDSEYTESDRFRELTSSVRYTSQCWGLELLYIKTPDDYGIFINVNLLGIGESGEHRLYRKSREEGVPAA
jgi:LPS-assembly protein